MVVIFEIIIEPGNINSTCNITPLLLSRNKYNFLPVVVLVFSLKFIFIFCQLGSSFANNVRYYWPVTHQSIDFVNFKDLMFCSYKVNITQSLPINNINSFNSTKLSVRNKNIKPYLCPHPSFSLTFFLTRSSV